MKTKTFYHPHQIVYFVVNSSISYYSRLLFWDSRFDSLDVIISRSIIRDFDLEIDYSEQKDLISLLNRF